jgi:hypothetical protein
MALLALRLKDRCDLPGKGDCSIGLRFGDPTDNAAGDRARWPCHGLPGQQFVESLDQFLLRRFPALVADAELIVDPPVVSDHVLHVEHKDFGRAFRAELIGHDIASVFERREN